MSDNDIDKWKNMYWSKHNECEILKKQLSDYKFVILKNNCIGNVVNVIKDKRYGFIDCDFSNDIFFHISNFIDIDLSEDSINRQVIFDIAMYKGKKNAVNIKYLNDKYTDIFQEVLNQDENTIDHKNTIDQENKLTIDILQKKQNVWYLNSKIESKDWYIWDVCLKNNIALTWNNNNENNSIYEKIKENDIIVFYLVGSGYCAILKVIGKLKNINDKYIDLFTESKKKTDVDREWWKKYMIKIPVVFLAKVNKREECINKPQNYNLTWTSGLRGSRCMKPKNKNWFEQVMYIYDKLNI